MRFFHIYFLHHLKMYYEVSDFEKMFDEMD